MLNYAGLCNTKSGFWFTWELSLLLVSLVRH